MASLYLCWLLIFLASRAAGSLLLKRCTVTLSAEEQWFPAFWIGFLGLASLGLAIAAFVPLNFAFAMGLLVLIACVREAPPAPRSFWLVLAAMSYVSTNPERLSDTVLYHRQLIDWMAHDGLVPGLGILHYRLGFSSSWLTWSALFDHGPLFARMGSASTGLALASVTVYWLQTVRTFMDGRASTASRFFAATAPLVCGYLLVESMVVSPSPNLGAGLAVMAVLWLSLVPGAAPLALVAAGAATTVKISAAILIPVCMFWTRRYLALALALAAPIAVANLRTTGCPFFPAAVFCTDADDSLGEERAHQVEHETRNWARYRGEYPADTEFWSLAWLPRWLSPARAKAEFVFLLAAAVTLAGKRVWDAAAAGGALGLAYIMVGAPDFRFGCGYVFSFIGRAIAELPFRLPAISSRLLTILAMLTLVAGGRLAEITPNASFPDVKLGWTNERFLRPPLAWSPTKVRNADRNGVQFRTPLGDDPRCGAAQRPCAPAGISTPTMHFCDGNAGVRRGFCR